MRNNKLSPARRDALSRAKRRDDCPLHDPIQAREERQRWGWQLARIRPSICTWQRIGLSASTTALLAGTVGAAAPGLLPPLPREVTPIAVFGEIAPGVCHPGIDLPTNGRSSPIAAASDGEIARVRVSGGGYGRALHLLLPDAREIVYAHLSRFAPAVEESCLAMQSRSGTFDLDWEPPPGLFRVQRGALLGYSGETEDGRPLLHVEVRENGAPRNPLDAGFAWPDQVAPRIEALRFVPLDPSARVNGRLDPFDVAVPHGVGLFGGPAAVLWGSIGIISVGADAFLGQKSPPAEVCLDLDGVRVYCADVGRRLGPGWNRASPEPSTPVQFQQRLYDPMEGDRGRLACGGDLKEGLHRIRIRSRDVAGNADTVDVSILVQSTPRVLEWMARPMEKNAWDLAVRVGLVTGDDPERTRLWVDLTEDGKRFPVRTLLGHLGSGWFLGEIAPLVPAGRIGLRFRLRTPSGLEAWEAVQSLDPIGLCGGAVLDTPAVAVDPRWLRLSWAAGCVPARAPTARLLVRGSAIPCEFSELPPADDEPLAWRFFAPARGGGSGASPRLEVTVDGSLHRWDLSNVFLATPRSELRWTSPDSALTLEVAAGTFYRPVWLAWSRTLRLEGGAVRGEGRMAGRSRTEQEDVLIERSDAHAIGPAGAEMDGPFRVSLRPHQQPQTDREAQRLRVFGRAGPLAAWEPRGGLWTGRAVVAVVDRLEEWILLDDQSEPWIYGMDPAAGSRSSVAVSDLRARIREEGSGIRGKDLEVLLDGIRVAAEWNPWSRSVRAGLGAIAAGEHRWEIRATDEAGNEARRSADFTISSRP